MNNGGECDCEVRTRFLRPWKPLGTSPWQGVMHAALTRPECLVGPRASALPALWRAQSLLFRAYSPLSWHTPLLLFPGQSHNAPLSHIPPGFAPGLLSWTEHLQYGRRAVTAAMELSRYLAHLSQRLHDAALVFHRCDIWVCKGQVHHHGTVVLQHPWEKDSDS